MSDFGWTVQDAEVDEMVRRFSGYEEPKGLCMDPATITLAITAFNFADMLWRKAQQAHDEGTISDEDFARIADAREAAVSRAHAADTEGETG